MNKLDSERSNSLVIIRVLLVTIFLIAIFFRVYGLHDQGIFTFDEKSMAYRATMFKDVISTGEPINFYNFHVDSKILWICMLTAQLLLFPENAMAIKFISVIFALWTIWLTYLFACKFYHSHSIGLLSAFFLSISTTHIYYSRGLLPEVAGGFFVMASLYFYCMVDKKNKSSTYLSAGLAGLSFLVNRFRGGMLLLYIVILDAYKSQEGKKNIKINFKKYLLFLIVSLGTIIAGVFVLDGALQLMGIHIPPYFKNLSAHLKLHTSMALNLFSLLSLPYFIAQIEGWPYLILILSSILFIKKPISPKIPLIFVLMQIAVGSIINEIVLRSLSIVLPFMAILAAIAIYHIAHFMKNHWAKKTVLFAMIAGLILNAWYQNDQVVQFKDDKTLASDQLKIKEYQEGLILTVGDVILMNILYIENQSNPQLFKLGRVDLIGLKKFREFGYDYILIKPKITKASFFAKYWTILENDCSPILVTENNDSMMLKLSLFDYNFNLRDTMHYLKRTQKLGYRLKVYDLKQCIERIENQGG